MAPKEDLSAVIPSICNTVTNLLLGAIVVVTCIFGYNVERPDHYRQHIILCTVGYFLMMTQGMLAMSKANGWSAPLNFFQRNLAHRGTAFVGATLSCTGSIIRMLNVNNNFNSTHGILGIVAFILTLLTLIGGLVSIFVENKRCIRIMHTIFGCLTFSCAVVVLCFGYNMETFRSFYTSQSADMMIAFTAIAALGVLASPVAGIWRRLFS